jgi:hypothetical protein
VNPFRWVIDALETVRSPSRHHGQPATLQRAQEWDRQRPTFFDPALRHFAFGHRQGEPTFDDAATAKRFHAARQRLMLHVLRVIARSPFREHVVLRGSFLLRATLGDLARDPHDLDFVVTPQTFTHDGEWAKALVAALPGLLAAHPLEADLHLDVAGMATDEIWTYERCRGRRILFPWRGEGLPAAGLQIDISFGEPLADAPVETRIAADLQMLAASPALSLAWKLLWLHTDIEPQGKDLYDATLLAERTVLPVEVLLAVLSHGRPFPVTEVPVGLLPVVDDVAWEDFGIEYGLGGEHTAAGYVARLRAALGPLLPPESRGVPGSQ